MAKPRKNLPQFDGGLFLTDGGIENRYRDLLQRHPQINVLGGCCGTDHRHIEDRAPGEPCQAAAAVKRR